MFPGEIYFNNDKQWASNVESATMEGMFEACLYGEQGTDENIGLDMRGFNCTNVTNMVETFAYTPFFTNINLGPEDQFDTAKCKNMDGMFRFCGSLNSTGNIYNTTAGDEKHFPTFTFSADTIVTSMFQGANIPVDLTNAKSIPEAADGVSGLSVISDYSRMFCDYGFYVLPKILDRRGEIFLNIDLVKSGDTWTPPDGSTMEEMFRGCKANVDLSALDVKNVTNFYAMFMSFGNIDQLDILEFKPGEITWPSKWKTNTENVIDMSCMFKGYKGKDNLSELFTENFETSNVVNMSEMFRGCKVLKLDLSNFNTAKVVDMSYMFSNEFLRPSYLTEVTFGDNFINENSVVKDMSYMFGSAIVDNEYLNIINCNADWAEIIEANGIACEGMFAGCRELAGNGNNPEIVTIYDPDHVTYEYAKPSYKDTDGVIHKGYFTGTPKNLVGVKVENKLESLSDAKSLSENETIKNPEEETATDEPVVVDDGEVVELNNEEAIQPLIESASFAILNVLNPAGFAVYNLFEFVVNL
ncbi:MAG: BspA family leucine-rich repeat surface protein [Coriobacteriia bacterium]|nr:BspA family leucine-rich repeat surface protein [Coriobacteriia bacterium]